jgi:hypothetical protein
MANMLFTRQLQKNFDAVNINAISMAIHPGLIKTGITLIEPNIFLLSSLD